jgi:hypothetical protein
MFTSNTSSTIQSKEGRVFGKSKPKTSRVASSKALTTIVPVPFSLKYIPELYLSTIANSYS